VEVEARPQDACATERVGGATLPVDTNGAADPKPSSVLPCEPLERPGWHRDRADDELPAALDGRR
jgi:hypothetical protein